MKIAISVFYDIRELEGTGLQAKRIADFFKKRFEVEIITGTNRSFKLVINKRVLIIRIFSVALRALFWNLKLLYKLIKNNYDMIYCANDYLGFPTIYALSKIKKYKIVYEAHGLMAEELREQNYHKIFINICERLERFIRDKANYIVTLSSTIFQFYHSHTNKRDKVELLHIFVNDNLFVPAQKNHTNRNKRTIGMIGPFDSPRKSQNLYFLYENIHKFDSRIKFIIIGYCEEKISSGHIEYVGYLESATKYASCLSQLDAVIIPETIATTGPLNKIIESMSCAIPVFTTPKGIIGLSSMEAGKNIFVFNIDELVEKVNELIFKDEIINQVGRNARKTIELHYSEKVNARKIEKIMKDLELIAGKG